MLKSKWLDYVLRGMAVAMLLLLAFCVWDYFTKPEGFL